MSASEPTILIVGAGPVGLTLACELYRHGVPCRIVDVAEGPTRWSKAIAVHARTMELFARMGLAGQALAHGRPARGVTIQAGGRPRLRVDLSGLDTPFPFVLGLNQSDTERLLHEHLASLDGAVEWRTRATALELRQDGAAVTLAGPDGASCQAAAQYVVACDGAHSFVRHAMGLPFPGQGYDEQFLLADVVLDWDRDPSAWAAILGRGTVFFAAALAPPGRWRIICRLPDGLPAPASLAQGASPSLEDVQALIDRSGPPGLHASDPAWTAWFRSSHRMMDRFRYGRVFFAGDAAHIHSPVGGQGMNTGIQDAFNLAWKLAAVAKGDAPASLLDSYDPERRPAAAGVVELTDVATRGLLATGPLGRLLLQQGLVALNRLEMLKRGMERRLSELSVDYRGSPAVAEAWGAGLAGAVAGGPHAGDRAPNVALRRPNGARTGLFDLLTGPGWHVLLVPARRIAAGAADQAGPLAARLNARYGGPFTVISVGGAGPAASGVVRLRSDRASMRRAYGALAGSLFLIRPDGVIGFRSWPADTDALLRYLDTVLLPQGGEAPSAPALAPADPPALLLSGLLAVGALSRLGRGRGAFRRLAGLGGLAAAGAVAARPSRPAGAAGVAALAVASTALQLDRGRLGRAVASAGTLALAASVLRAVARRR